MQVTVIIPIFNAEKYLRNAIDSLLCQTSQAWKVICIDDGSTDSSLRIIEEYCNKDKRITLIKQANAGPAVARARAIEIADTEYVSILDADDAYAHDYIETMLNRAKKTDADSIVPNVEFGYGNTKKLPDLFTKLTINPDTLILNGREAFSMTIPWFLHGWQMVKTSLAKKYYTVELASYSKFNSDEYITRLLYLKSSKTVLSKAKYLYRISEGSITRTATLKKLDYLITLSKLIDLIKKENIDIQVLLRLYNDFYIILRQIFALIPELPKQDQKEGKLYILDSYNRVYRKNMSIALLRIAPIRTKIKLILSLISYRLIK